MKLANLLLCLTVSLPLTTVHAATILVTGSDRGLGLEFVRQYAIRGAQVIATCRHPDTATELKALAAGSHNIVIEKLDVADDAEIRAIASKYKGHPIDLLINNAAVLGAPEEQKSGSFSRKSFQETMGVNVFGALAVSDALRENIIASKEKKIVALTSAFGSIPTVLRLQLPQSPYYYEISKAALNMAMQALGSELKPQGVIVGILNPGSVDTDLLAAGKATYKLNVQALSKAESIGKLISVIDHLDQDKAAQGINNYSGSITPW